MQALYRSQLNTPIGPVSILASEDAIVQVAFGELPETGPESPLTLEACSQLEAYFAGNRRQFDLPLAPAGTSFQREAWAALQQIPFGETRSYAQQAMQVNRPKAVRAIGAANGANPIAIVIPCHRVIGKNGTLTGYAGGVERKQWLLALEQAQVGSGSPA